MKRNKFIAAVLTTTLAAALLLTPANTMTTQAANNGDRVYVTNKATDIGRVSISAPGLTGNLYAGLTWEQLEIGCGTRLNVTDSECGKEAMAAYNNKAAELGASVVKVLDMDLEAYLDKGWTKDIEATAAPIRVAITLPASASASKDYAILSMKTDGNIEVMGDLDAEPATITVDSGYFDTFVIVSGKKGAFDAYKKASATALQEATVSSYAKDVYSSVNVETACDQLYDIGIITDQATTRSMLGVGAVLSIKDGIPGPSAKSAMQYAIKKTASRNSAYYTIKLKDGWGSTVTKTSSKLRVTMTVPFNFPAYADYAVAVLNADGSCTIYKDIDLNDSTITIDTDQFREYAIIWGAKGAFANCK